jgi:SAM-dependent methyltransferase
MGTSPAGHAQFFRHAFARLPVKRARILIAGGADYSMLAHAAAACRECGIEAEFTMADWCETPLALARWYAQRESITLRTECRDLLEPGAQAEFDAVCTHAFLGHFRPDRRPSLAANLGRALRPGGLLFLANRLRPGAADEPAVFSAAQVEAFAAEVARKAAGLPGADPASLAAGARAYAARQVSWPVRSLQELRGLLEAAGLRVEQLSSAAMAGATGTLNVPTIAGGADYAHVLAVRP